MNLSTFQGLRRLVEDHRLVEREATLVEQLYAEARDLAGRRKAVDRTRLFLGVVGATLRSHFLAEEEALAGTPEGRLLQEEHRRIWLLAQSTTEVLPQAEVANGFPALEQAATSLILLLRSHIEREERDLYGILSSPGGTPPPP